MLMPAQKSWLRHKAGGSNTHGKEARWEEWARGVINFLM
jgi:hypothetical protein